MQRRDLLKLLGLSTLASGFARADAAKPGPAVVLIKLAGGNDGLNTVVPAREAAYQQARPRLALAPRELVPLSAAKAGLPWLGLHPSLAPMKPHLGELAVVLGLGYPQPNRSHFRSSEIWERGDAKAKADGWLSHLLVPGTGEDLDALVVGGALGPVEGVERALVLNDVGALRERRKRHAPPKAVVSSALAHVLHTERVLVETTQAVQSRLAAAPALPVEFAELGDKSPFGRALGGATRALIGGLRVPLIHLTLGGFDTHKGQRAKHAKLLEQLGAGLVSARANLKRAGRWEDTLIVTYSEFGRRVRENASGGTDHGTAAPHFVFGGKVLGGVYGAHPSLTELDAGDLKSTTDFRSLYRLVARHLRLPPGKLAGAELNVLKA